MNKQLRKAIMTRSRLKNKYNKNRTQDNWAAYKHKRNLCVSMLRQSKKSYYQQLDPKLLRQ